MTDWRAELDDARCPLTSEQSTWDGHWRRWLAIALRTGRGYPDAIDIAYTRTEAQYGCRPGTQPAKENQP